MVPATVPAAAGASADAGCGPSGLFFGVRGFGIWDRLHTEPGAKDRGTGCLPASQDRLFAACLPETASREDAVGVADAMDLDRLDLRVVVRCRPPSGGGAALRLVPTPAASGCLLHADAPGIRPRAFCLDAFLGADVVQASAFAHVAHLAELVVGGGNCAVLTCGAAGTGKTYTLSGPRGLYIGSCDAEEAGVLQRMTDRIFECIAKKSLKGEVFVVEASFMQVLTPADGREELGDLLAEEAKNLRIRQDEATQAYHCEGLRSLQLSSPGQICTLVARGLDRSAELASAAASAAAARSGRARGGTASTPPLLQRVFTLKLERLLLEDGSFEPTVSQSRIHFIDVAGGGAATEQMYTAARQPSLSKLLRNCALSGSKVVLFAHVSSDAVDADDTFRVLQHVQSFKAIHGAAAGAPVTSIGQSEVEDGNAPHSTDRTEGQQSAQDLRSRNLECIRLLSNMAQEAKNEPALSEGVAAMAERVSEGERAHRLWLEQSKRFDEVREEMGQDISFGLEMIKAHAVGSLHTLTETVQTHFSTLEQEWHMAKADAAALVTLTDELRDVQFSRRAFETEAFGLRERLASMEMRAKMLQEEHDDVGRQRRAFAEEKAVIRHTAEGQRCKQTDTERELFKLMAEKHANSLKLQRLAGVRVAAVQALHEDRAAWKVREADLSDACERLRRELQEAKFAAAGAKERAQNGCGETCRELRRQVQLLDDVNGSIALQLDAAKETKAKLEVEHRIAQQRVEDLQLERVQLLARKREELRELIRKEDELKTMFNEVEREVLDSSDGEAVGDVES